MEVIGSMLAFWINYGVSLNETGNAIWQIPLAMQCLPPTLLFVSMLFLNETPRWLARTDQWEKSVQVLSHVRHLPESHPYVQQEVIEMKRQLEEELASVNGGTGFVPILKEVCCTCLGRAEWRWSIDPFALPGLRLLKKLTFDTDVHNCW